MKRSFTLCALVVTIIFCSCSSKPSKEQISKKLLIEYVCPESAKVNTLTILSSKKTETFVGTPAIEYVISGEVEWPNGCNEYFQNLPAGYKEKFENKIVTLAKTDEGWQ